MACYQLPTFDIIVSPVPIPSRGPWLVVEWVVFVICDTVAQVGFKLTAGRLPHALFSGEWWRSAASSSELWAATGALILAFFCWLKILKHSRVGVGFAATSITLVTVLIASTLWLGEQVNLTQCFGGALIIVGIFLLQGIPE